MNFKIFLYYFQHSNPVGPVRVKVNPFNKFYQMIIIVICYFLQLYLLCLIENDSFLIFGGNGPNFEINKLVKIISNKNSYHTLE